MQKIKLPLKRKTLRLDIDVKIERSLFPNDKVDVLFKTPAPKSFRRFADKVRTASVSHLNLKNKLV